MNFVNILKTFRLSLIVNLLSTELQIQMHADIATWVAKIMNNVMFRLLLSKSA